MDFEVQKSTRQCAMEERDLRPGEPFYSVLCEIDGEVVRMDYCEKAWDGPPQDCIGWWKSRMPEPDNTKVNWAPNDVMMHYFQQLEGSPEKHDLRYVLALLMVRRRILKLEGSEEDEQGQELLVLFCPRDEQEYRIAVHDLSQARIEEIQNELSGMLFADAA